jgi:hypothetical protein
MPYLHWNSVPTTEADARTTLEAIIDLARVELPFAAQVGQLARSAETVVELERYCASLYRIALEHGHWALPDLIDSLLLWAEQVEQDAILSLPWSDATPTA